MTLREYNSQIIYSLTSQEAFSEDTSLSFQQIDTQCPDKLKLLLLNEFVRNEMIYVTNNRFYLNKQKYQHEKRRAYVVYLCILIVPIIIGSWMFIRGVGS